MKVFRDILRVFRDLLAVLVIPLVLRMLFFSFYVFSPLP